MALTCGLVLGLAEALVVTGMAYFKIKTHYENALAEQIASAERTLAQNQETFRELAVADAPVHIARSADNKVPSHGGEISEMSKFHELTIIAKSAYYKRIMRFPRFPKPVMIKASTELAYFI